ncbi:MAG: sigma-70 family RNA polymerase sigma factor [Phycisphaerales bacterium]|jgi:RNA polymerase sigma-70 factor (ECF subfamily)|nr:sigma-70 family RNA polymerase sigma factor [Phycisphaerales bacterium]
MPQPEHSPQDLHERELVERAKAGDAAAWTELLSSYQHRLFTVCLRMVGDRELAADLTQDALVKLIENIGAYDGRSRLSTWLIRITMNLCLSKLRAEKHRRHAPLETGISDQDPSSRGGRERGELGHARTPRGIDYAEPGEGPGVERVSERSRVSRALLEVSEEHRAILVLRDVRGLDYDQIAAVLGVPEGTVKSRLFRARAALREAFERLAED